jgi:hypothetical protein
MRQRTDLRLQAIAEAAEARQRHGHDDSKTAGHNVPNSRGQRELPRQASVRPKHEEDAAADTIDLSRHDPRQGYRGDEACDACSVLGLLNRGEAENVGTLKLYPTDALDPRNGARLRNVLPLLIDESTRQFLERRIIMSEEIKRSSHFTLVIGNPPYKNNSTRTLAQVASSLLL